MSESQDVLEVSYQESVTKLFFAIEEMEFRDAFDIIESDPKQVRTWVRSSGKEHTTFDWSFWRRLPIHEACMRRAPAWLVSELLTTFPESASMTTNLGEYALHLAVDKACAPEVVNLIIVANWKSIIAQDQAGRTPLDIIDQTELLELESNRIIFESLKRCHQTYMEIQKAAHDEKSALVRKQKATADMVSKEHQEELKREHGIQAKLEEDIEELKMQIKDRDGLIKAKDRQLHKHVLAKKKWIETIGELEAAKADQYQELENNKTQFKDLFLEIDRKEEEIQRKNKKIDVLSKDLWTIALSNESDVFDSLIATEQSMRTMVSNQIALQKLLNSKSEGLKTILKQRGITIPDVDIQNAPETHDENVILDDDDIHEEAATNAMMAAAIAALQPKE